MGEDARDRFTIRAVRPTPTLRELVRELGKDHDIDFMEVETLETGPPTLTVETKCGRDTMEGDVTRDALERALAKTACEVKEKPKEGSKDAAVREEVPAGAAASAGAAAGAGDAAAGAPAAPAPTGGSPGESGTINGADAAAQDAAVKPDAGPPAQGP